MWCSKREPPGLSRPMEYPFAMEAESCEAPDNQFTHSGYTQLAPFSSPQHYSPPRSECTGFGQDHSALVATDITYSTMPMPPPYASMLTPVHFWPSILAQAPFHAAGVPSVPPTTSVLPSASTPPVRRTSTGALTQRRTLTVEDRRQMCLYHEKNEAATHTDIGGKKDWQYYTVNYGKGYTDWDILDSFVRCRKKVDYGVFHYLCLS